MSALNLQRKFGHYSISVPVAPSSMPKLLTPLATIFVEIFKKENNLGGFRPVQSLKGRKFKYLEKNGVLKFFEQVNHPESVVHALDYD